MVKSGIGLVFAACVFLPACGDDDEPKDETAIEIQGSWESDFGGTEVIDADSWAVTISATSVNQIVEFSNDENDAILLSPEDAEFDPGTYSRNVWTEVSDGSFYYCTVSYGQPSAEAAVSESQSYDETDPEGGCGDMGFAWTMLTRQ